MQVIEWPWRQLPHNIDRHTLGIVAATIMGYRGPAAVASIVFGMDEPSEEAKKKVRRTIKLKSGQVAFLLRNGFPEGMQISLSRAIRCQRCRCYVTEAPCMLCYRPTYRILEQFMRAVAAAERSEPKLRISRRPTMSAPGTEAKIKEMRQRVERGESPFHDSDATHAEGITDGARYSRVQPSQRHGSESLAAQHGMVANEDRAVCQKAC